MCVQRACAVIKLKDHPYLGLLRENIVFKLINDLDAFRSKLLFIALNSCCVTLHARSFW